MTPRLHLAVGLLVIAAFVGTGQYMGHHSPPMAALSDSDRLMFRSRHIYILAGGLVNLVLGVYMRRRPRGWRRIVQAVGSALIIASPALLIVAFVVEPSRRFRGEMPLEFERLVRTFRRQHVAFRLRCWQIRKERLTGCTIALPLQ